MTGADRDDCQGPLADLVVVDGDPLKDIALLQGDGAHMPLIVAGGRVIKEGEGPTEHDTLA